LQASIGVGATAGRLSDLRRNKTAKTAKSAKVAKCDQAMLVRKEGRIGNDRKFCSSSSG
jgi:hypothetical protein